MSPEYFLVVLENNHCTYHIDSFNAAFAKNYTHCNLFLDIADRIHSTSDSVVKIDVDVRSDTSTRHRQILEFYAKIMATRDYAATLVVNLIGKLLAFLYAVLVLYNLLLNVIADIILCVLIMKVVSVHQEIQLLVVGSGETSSPG